MIGAACALVLASNASGQTGGQTLKQNATAASTAPSTSLSGRIVNASTGEGLAKVELRLMASRSGVQPASNSFVARTSADGTFELNGLHGGQYVLTVTRRAFATSSAEIRGFTSARRLGLGWLISLPEGQAVRNAEIRLPPAAVVTGQVVDEDGEPMMGVVVEAEQYRYLQGSRTLFAAARATSDDRGIYRLYDLAPGRYFIKTRSSGQRSRFGGVFVPNGPAGSVDSGAASARAGRGQIFGGGAGRDGEEAFSYPDTYYPKAHSASEAIPLQLAPGAEMAGIDFALSPAPTYSISGTVTGIPSASQATGEFPRNSVLVTVLPAGQYAFTAPSAMAPANPATGEFTIHGVAPGNYQLIARLNSRGRNGGSSIGVARVNVANASADGVSISILEDVTVPGRVILPEGSGASSPARISITAVRRLSVGRSSARVNADGTFEMNLPRAEPLRFEVASIPEGLYVKRIVVGAVDVLRNPAYSLAGDGGRMSVELAGDGANLSGMVRDSRGVGIANARVSLMPTSSFATEEDAAGLIWRRTATTADDGSFAISAIAPGRYRLYAFEALDADPSFDVAFLSNFGQRWKDVELKPRENATVEVAPISSSESEMYLDEAQ